MSMSQASHARGDIAKWLLPCRGVLVEVEERLRAASTVGGRRALWQYLTCFVTIPVTKHHDSVTKHEGV